MLLAWSLHNPSYGSYRETPHGTSTRLKPMFITMTDPIIIGGQIHFIPLFIGKSILEPSSFDYSRAALSNKYHDCRVIPSGTRDTFLEVSRNNYFIVSKFAQPRRIGCTRAT
jgi:hypothetical protein